MTCLHTIKIALAGIVLMAGAVWVAPASAQEEQPVTLGNIAVVNMDKVRANSDAFQKAMEQIKANSEDANSQLQQENDALRAANEELGRKRTILAPDAFAAERKDFEERVANFQRKVQEQQKSLNQLQADVSGEINQKILQIISELAQERGYFLVLPASNVILRADVMDIDDEVLARLNQQMPSVSVPLPGN